MAYAVAVHTPTPISRCRHRRLCSTLSRRDGAGSAVPRASSSSSSSSSSTTSTSTTKPTPHRHVEDVILTSARTTEMAHALWRAVLREGDIAIDATMGNGWDTMILAKLVLGRHPGGGHGDRDGDGDGDGVPKGEDAATTTTATTTTATTTKGRVVAFDIQQGALDSTRLKVEQELAPEHAARVHLVLGSHDTLEQHVDVGGGDEVGVVCFNLGYLPGSDDKAVVTRRESTVRAVQASVRVLRPGGVLTVIGYTGHEGGWEEVEAVMSFVSGLDPRLFTASNHTIVNRDNCPQLIAVHRKK